MNSLNSTPSDGREMAKAQPPIFPKRWYQHLYSPVPWFVLLFFTALTLFAAWMNARSTSGVNEQHFENKVDELVAAIEDRLSAYRMVLLGFAGLLEIEGQVNRQQWQAFYEAYELDKFYPGIQGVGFARLVPFESWQAYQADIREQGDASYTLTPEPKSDPLTAIEILEPSDWRNQRTMGFDMWSNPVRRQAMELAWQTGETSISGMVTLLQETQNDVQPGFLMYLGYFRSEAKEQAQDGSDKALVGWIFAPFRVNDLIEGVFPNKSKQITFSLYDESVSSASLMYRSDRARDKGARFTSTRRITFGQRDWLIVAESLPVFEMYNDNRLSRFILLAGLLEAISLFVLSVIFMATRHNAKVQEKLLQDKQSSENRISAILNSTTTALLTTDMEGNIVDANSQAAELFGYARQTLLSMNVESLVPTEYRERHKLYRRKFNQEPYRRPMGSDKELYAQNVRGELIPVEIGLSPIKTDAGLQVLASIVDIRERLKDKRERERILEQLSAKNVEMEQFVYTVSHDLKSPLVTINGFTKLLRDSMQDKLDDKQSHWLDRISANVQSMEGLLNDLLELSRIIHRTLEIEEVQLEDIYAEVCSSLSQQIRETGAEITLDLQEPVIYAHKRLVVQCMQNLLSNAMQYRKPEAICEITIRAYNEGEWTIISVADNGIGIAPAHQARIFEIFERLSAKSSSGTGVGLAVVKTAMEKHGGYVTVKSELGRGSDFMLHFPRI